MVDPQLLEYIKKEISKGFTLDKIKQMLLQYNYPEQTIIEAFNLLGQETKENTPLSDVNKQEQQITEIQPEPQEVQQNIPPISNAAPVIEQITQQNPVNKIQKTSLHYIYILSGLISVIVIIQFITSDFSSIDFIENLISSLVFLFIACMTVICAKQRFIKPKLALLYKIFLVLNIIILFMLIYGMFSG